MYYYIIEPKGSRGNWQEKVKDILGDLGIAGETVTPSPARTVEELATLGLVKGYSTIVAVGSEKIVNTIVNCIINQKETSEVVLGIIPEDYNSVMARTINVKDIKDACNALKYRKLKTIDAVYIEPNKYFLTEAIIESVKPRDAYILTSEIKAGVLFNKITIRPGLKIDVYDTSKNITKGNFLTRLFGKHKIANGSSYFQTKKVKIEVTDGGAPVKIEGEVIAKTPIVCHNRPEALKLIVARDTMRAGIIDKEE